MFLLGGERTSGLEFSARIHCFESTAKTAYLGKGTARDNSLLEVAILHDRNVCALHVIFDSLKDKLQRIHPRHLSLSLS